MQLVVGNKNYSSWSLRGWLLLRAFGIPFTEVQVWLDAGPEAAAELRRLSPSARVPCLIDDGLVVWDSLAIAEYVAEKFPAAGIWPRDARHRALARSVCAEMHSGFTALRKALPMNIRNRYPAAPIGEDARADVARIAAIWRECLQASGGPFLFGAFSAADAFFAPVAARLRSYGVTLEADLERYVDAVLGHTAMKEWCAAAAVEGHASATYDDIYPR